MKFFEICSLLVFLIFKCVQNNIIDPVKDFKSNVHRKCNHEKKGYKKNYLSGKYDRKLANAYYTDIQFQNLRMHFDYTYTLPHEEKMIKELVMPPVQKFYENSLSVRRFPGKIRFPKSVGDCQGIPVPQHLQKEGVDSDLVIIVSTYRGMKKYYYEKVYGTGVTWSQFNGRKKPTDTSTEGIEGGKSKNKLTEYLEKYFSKKKKLKGKDVFDNMYNKNGNSSNIPPWEINDSPGDVVGWSFMCLQDIYTLRPLAGVMQFVADINPTPRAIEEAIWTTLHEIMHVLAMDFDLYADFIDPDFNRLGYDKTIKMKTRLKDLDKMLEERKEVLNDLTAFASFNSSLYTNTNKNYTKESNSTSNENCTQIIESNNSTTLPDSNPSKRNNKLRKSRNNINENIVMFEKVIKNVSDSDNSTNSNSIFTGAFPLQNNSSLSSSDESSTINPQNITVSSTMENSTSIQDPQISTVNSEEISDTLLNLKSQILRSINLPVVDQFYEINVPKNINLTVLVHYISNFLDNTKLFIKTPKVIEYGKKHFGCPTVDGVELEHFGGLGSSFSHWSKRILNTEFMIADSYGENYISNFTLALLEDSGWYKVDYSKSEVIPWGRNKGCEFLDEKCITKKKKKNSFFSLNLGVANSINEKDKNLATHSNIYDSNFKDEFCTSFDEERCSISHTFRAICGVGTFENEIPKQYQYFDSPNVGGYVNFGDYCPYPLEWMDRSSVTPMGSCRNGIQFRQDIGEKVCENCRCFHSSLVEEKFYKKSSELMKNEPKKVKFNNLEETRAACYEARCKIDKKGQVELVIIVDDFEIKCPRGGAILSVDGYKGFVECPKVSSVCTGTLDPKGDYTNTSAYNLFSHLSEQLLNILYDFIKSMFNN